MSSFVRTSQIHASNLPHSNSNSVLDFIKLIPCQIEKPTDKMSPFSLPPTSSLIHLSTITNSASIHV